MYMYKKDLALNNLQWSICYKTKPNITILTRHAHATLKRLKNWTKNTIYRSQFRLVSYFCRKLFFILFLS